MKMQIRNTTLIDLKIYYYDFAEDKPWNYVIIPAGRARHIHEDKDCIEIKELGG